MHDPEWLEARKMPYNNVSLRFRRNGEFYLVDLAEFPHGQFIKSDLDKAFFEVPPGVHVVAYNTDTREAVLAPVSMWSTHFNRELFIVHTKHGDIITDDDPRAVFGIDSNYVYRRWRPQEATGVYVPRISVWPEQDTGEPEIIASVTMKGQEIEFTPELVYSLGILFGRGDISMKHREGKRRSAEMQRLDDEAVAHIKNIFENSADFAATLMRWCGAHDCERIPAFILSMSRELRRVYAAGIIDNRATVEKGPRPVVRFRAKTYQNIHRIQTLFMTLGIASKVDSWRKAPRLTLSCADLREQRLPVRRARDIFGQVHTVPRTDSVPVSAGLTSCVIKRLRKAHNEPSTVSMWRDANEEKAFRAAWYNARKDGHISRRNGQLVIARYNYFDHPHWEQFCRLIWNKDVKWSKVTGFTDTYAIEDCYDITVPGYDTFAGADGLVRSSTVDL
jgi:hypothetical protein